MPGTWELLIILGIVLLVFGAGKLPQIGDAMGRAIKNVKRSTSGKDEIEVSKKQEIETGAADAQVADAQVIKESKKA